MGRLFILMLLKPQRSTGSKHTLLHLRDLRNLRRWRKVKREAQTLESILVSGDRDFVIGKDGAKIPVSDLVGKNVLLYFSAHWCPPCSERIEAHDKIKANDDALDVIFISSDKNQASFDEFFATMPWLALPFGDERKVSLSGLFKVGCHWANRQDCYN